MSAWAVPGTKCVCILDDWGSISCGEFSLPVRVPMLNEVLTVAGVSHDDEHGITLTFVEIPHRQSNGPLSADVSYDADCFRPLTTRTQEQDLAIFRPMLTDLPVGEDA